MSGETDNNFFHTNLGDGSSVNDAPVAPESEDHVLQDVRELTGAIAATDVDGDVLSYEVTGTPENGTLVVNAATGSWEYRPEDLYMGADSAVVTVSDGNGGTTTTTLNFDVRVSAPSVGDMDLSLQEDGTLSDQLVVDNPVGGRLRYRISGLGGNGSFRINSGGEFTYTPNADYNGADHVVLTVTNEYGLSDSVRLNFDVAPVNDAPVAPESEDHVLQDVRELTGAIAASDVDGDVLSYEVTGAPENGTLTVDAATGSWEYQPDDLYMGADSAVVTVSDDNGGTTTTTLNFDVRVSTPSVADQDLSLLEDGTLSDQLVVDNPVGGRLRYRISGLGGNGSFRINSGGEFTYTPNADYNGADHVVLTVTNEYGLSDSVRLNFDVAPVNDAPVAPESEDHVLQDVRELTGAIAASDVDGDVLSYEVTGAPENGTLTVDAATGNWEYQPDDLYVGADSAVVTVSDGNGGTATTTLNFDVQVTDHSVYEQGDVVVEGDGSGSILLKDISKDDLTLTREADDLRVSVKNKGSLTFTDYFASPDKGIGQLQTLEGPLYLSKETIKEGDASGCRFWGKRWINGDWYQENLLYGTDRREILIGGREHDVLFGAGGSDYLFGSNGNDTLIGGEGNDHLVGWRDDDTLYGDAGNDRMDGGSGNDALIGGQGNDRLSGDNGDDWLYGDSGNDRLYGDDGADVIVGGDGNDLLKGGSGDDIYRFNAGDGRDTLWDRSSSGCFWFRRRDGGFDTVQFGEDITKDDVAIFQSRGNLQIQYGEEDRVDVRNQRSSREKVERFELADGSYLTDADVNRIIQEISAYAAEEGICLRSVEDVRENETMMAMVADSWHTV